MNGEITSYARDFREKARRSLEGKWGIAILAGFIATLFSGGFGNGSSWRESAERLSDTGVGVFESVSSIFLLFASLGIILAIVSFFVGGAINLGYKTFLLHMVRQEDASIGDLFSRFDIFWRAFLLQLLTGIYIVLWALLLVVPGILAAYNYAMAPYLMTEHPEMSASEAIRESKRIMYGNRWRLFCLQISFFGWSILCVFTCGIGLLFLKPYEDVAVAHFYEELTQQDRNFDQPEVIEEDPFKEF